MDEPNFPRSVLYVVLLLCLVASPQTTSAQGFTKHVIDGNLDWASGVAVANLDGKVEFHDIRVLANRDGESLCVSRKPDSSG